MATAFLYMFLLVLWYCTLDIAGVRIVFSLSPEPLPYTIQQWFQFPVYRTAIFFT
jgi:hypothetical protein